MKNKIYRFIICNSIYDEKHFRKTLLFNINICKCNNFKKYINQDSNLLYYCIVSVICNILMIFFLIIAYISVFGEYEGRRAAFERYIAQWDLSLIPLSIIINYKDKFNIKNKF